jgi:PAS domain S-box-containing protein
VEDLENAEEEQLKECAHLEPEGAKDLLLNRSFLFDKSTMYLHTYLFDRVSYVIRANEAFQLTTGYAEEEIHGLELREVLPTLIKHSHDESLLNWMEKGESNNYEQYPIRFTELKAKDGSHVPVVKYFKIIVNLHVRTEHFLEFVCMLKLNTAELSFGKQE